MTVSVVVPTWNRADLLREMLESLRTQTRPPDEIVIVDNGSTDHTPEVAAQFGAKRITLATNAGFAGAINQGVKTANGDWLLLANNDVVFPADWLERILETAHATGAQFATGKLLQSSDARRLDGTWDMLSRGAHAWRCGFGRADGQTWAQQRRIWFAPMTAALFHRGIFDQIGFLDTRFEAYYEDIDFGIRCALAGIEGVYEPAAVAVHKGSSTLGRHGKRVWYLTCRNQVLLLAKHYPARTLRRFAWPILVGQALSVLAAASHGRFFTALKAKWDGLRLWRQFRERPIKQQPGNALHDGLARPSELLNCEDQASLDCRASDAVESVLMRSESELREIQKRIGFDPYWRIYFGLVRS